MDSFGLRLKREREKRKISLDDVSAVTKISNRFLSAIESGEFDQLPGGIFNRGFIRAYARHLGLDEEEIIADYKAVTGEDDANVPAENDIAQDAALKPTITSVDIPWKEVVVLLLLLAVGLSIWQFRSREEGKSTRETSLGRASASASSTSDVETAGHITPTVTGESKPELGLRAGRQPFQLRVIARENSWISVSGSEGEILQQVLTPPEEKSFHSSNRITVKVGNAAGVQFLCNGHEMPVQGKEGEVKTFIFDSNGIHEPVPSVGP